MNRISIIMFLLVFGLGCTKTEKPISPQETLQPPPIKTGKLVENVACLDDSLNTYAIYVPLSYVPEKSSPVIFIFDAHARGSLPVGRYQALAEKYNMILAASNKSQNGVPWESLQATARIMMKDVRDRFSIDPRRIYAMGFSGGSRVAVSVAMTEGSIAGVIGCGAGFPSVNQPLRPTFHYLGFVGKEDFNYIEMKAWDKLLEQNGLRHQLILFDGAHDWPDAETMTWGFLWLEANAYRSNKAFRNESVINDIVRRHEALLSALRYTGQTNRVYEVYRQLVTFLDGLDDLAGYRETMAQLERSYSVKTAQPNEERSLARETARQKEYAQYLDSKNLAWWKTEIRRLRDQMKTDKNAEQVLQNKRLLNYLSLAAFMKAQSSVSGDNTDIAENFLGIYTLVDPQNCEHRYLWACVYAQERKFDKVIASLKEAIALGFHDQKRLEQESVLAPLKLMPEYQDIVKTMSGPSL